MLFANHAVEGQVDANHKLSWHIVKKSTDAIQTMSSKCATNQGNAIPGI